MMFPNGVFLMQDIGASSHLQDNLAHPFAPFLYSLSTMHCMTVSLALDGVGLGAVWGGQQARAMLDAAGFTRVDVHRLEEDPLNEELLYRSPLLPYPTEHPLLDLCLPLRKLLQGIAVAEIDQIIDGLKL
jgi:hypothetical protein